MDLTLEFRPQDRQIAKISFAVVFSLFAHGLLALIFWTLPFQEMAIPLKKIPIEIKRVELSPKTPESTLLPSMATPAPAILTPPPQLPTLQPTLERNLEIPSPTLLLPSLPESPVAMAPQFSPSASALSTPFKPTDISEIQAQIAQFQTGAPSIGAPVLSPDNKTSLAQGIGTTPAIGGITGSTPAGSPPPIRLDTIQAPSFETLTSQIKDLSLGGRLKMPQPVLLRFPSDILFEFDVSDLKPQASRLLQQALPYIYKFSTAQITIEGHTDTFGTDEYNQKLSELRAKTVEEWFRKNLEKPYQLQSRGFGKRKVIVNPQGSIAEQAKNRRVEILIQGLE